MAEEKKHRLSKVASKLNVGLNSVVDFLTKKGYEVSRNPNSKLSEEEFRLVAKEFQGSAQDKEEAAELQIGTSKRAANAGNETSKKETAKKEEEFQEEKQVFIKNMSDEPLTPKKEEEKPQQKEIPKVEDPQLEGLKVVGKIDLDALKKPSPKPAEKKKAAEPKKATPPKAQEKKPSEEKIEKTDAAKVNPPKKEAAPEKPAQTEKATKETPEKPVSENKVLEKENTVEAATKKDAPQAKGTSEGNADQKGTTTGESGKVITAQADKLQGLKVVGKIDLSSFERKPKKKPIASSDDKGRGKKRQRKRITKDGQGNVQNQGGQQGGNQQGGGNRNQQGGGNRNQQSQGGGNRNQQGGGNRNQQGGGGNRNQQGGGRGRNQNQNRKGGRKPQPQKEELTDKQIQEQIKQTLAKLSGGNKGNQASNRSKYRKDKRNRASEAFEAEMEQERLDAKKLKVTEFISANDLATLMEVSVNEVIATAMNMGMFVSINQRLDAEAITLLADEFGYDAEFASAEDETEVTVVEDKAEDLQERAPIVTIMGHVDHGKTSLLDYIRNANVTASEAGGITQHIGAYDVMTETGKRVAFLDTPGHEAFTAMRARGAKVTDVAIIVVAADDAVMPQTKEAINHAQVAGVPIVIAINKIDKPAANADKIRDELSQMNILVEDWGGKYQCQEISAKSGQGVEELLEKVLLEAEILELKANPNREAAGTVVEASLDKGRGYVATMLVENGTLNIGDIMLAGQHYGKVKAMYDHRGNRLESVGPATPVQVLGLDGAPQAGDKLNVMETDREAREIATKRQQLAREQSVRTKKHITLDEIGRRLAIGSFQELNIIVKGDVDGSVEALSDSLLKLSTDEVAVNIIHKAVGQISESDVLLASASDAIIIGFQVRPSVQARRIAESEEIDIRLYSIIYDAINEVKDAMEGMLAPEEQEVIMGNAEVRETFKISKVGTIAGCMVTDGIIKRGNDVRLIRDGIVIYSGALGALKRFKDDVAEVKKGYDCGISINGFNDIKIGDVIESYEIQETKRTL
ncbi:translation initiation factor IF-2 [Persicobacter sp. CCB-QB2]|uniref:translation initiation factor IF-2 n=1 Tax=Persicobacter sp. CCB-QB2 TaxID=1561025 RepID=UPI0006A966B0|nr:translation initiation factor IF-2 [Persicobacter sp. CCB-QB2]